tara:strand:- start:765 stop:1025 length:261 start_codon:yes stop_codon:yes gene_type:complete
MSLVIYEVCKRKPEKRTHYSIEVFLNHEDAKEHLRHLNKITRIRLARQYRKLSGVTPQSKDFQKAQQIEDEICKGTYQIIERRVET